MYEQGRREPNNRMLFKICKLFDVSSDYILDKNFFQIENPKLKKLSEHNDRERMNFRIITGNRI